MIDGKLTLTKDGRLPIDPQNGLPATGIYRFTKVNKSCLREIMVDLRTNR